MTPRAFTHIDTWVFDLDNTLYPHHVNLWQQVDARIGEFISAVQHRVAHRAARQHTVYDNNGGGISMNATIGIKSE